MRFEREAKAAAHLNHPNVASIFHRGQDGDTYFYAMQFIEGETFDAFVKRRGPLPAELALRLILQATQGLAAASTRGLIHRDIKPANLMLVHQEDCDGDDDELLVKVIDFGLAKYLNKPGEDSGISLTGDRIVGTPYYMSPEQIEPEGKEIDARADIYSLGVTLWHLLVGKPPYRGTELQVLIQHLNKSLPWEQLPASVPPSVHDLLERMMAKEPADRPANHRELVGLIKQQLRMLTGGAAPGAGISPVPMAAGQAPVQEVVEQSSGLPLPPADFSMADVLDRRGRLTTSEVLGLLSLLTPVVDAKREQEGQTYDLTPARIFVRFDTPPSAGADLPAQGLDTWPPSQLEIATAPGTSPAATSDHPARSLGGLAYELLVGHAPDDTYEPVPGVNARGNAVLRQVLEATDAFGSAVRFAEAFRLSLAGELHVPAAPVQEVAAAAAGWDSGTRDLPLGGSLLAKPIRQARRSPARGVAVFALLLALAAGGWYAVTRPGTVLTGSTSAPAATSPEPSPSAVPAVQVGNPAEMGRVAARHHHHPGGAPVRAAAVLSARGQGGPATGNDGAGSGRGRGGQRDRDDDQTEFRVCVAGRGGHAGGPFVEVRSGAPERGGRAEPDVAIHRVQAPAARPAAGRTGEVASGKARATVSPPQASFKVGLPLRGNPDSRDGIRH